MVDIRVPPLGESVSEATVATWFKKVGDAVKVDEMLCELETDKVTVEVPSKAAGVLAEIVAKAGRDRRRRRAPRHHRREGDGGKPPKPADEAGREARGEAGRQGRGKAAPADAESAPANESSIEIMVPTLGESVTEATVSTWFKKPGDAVTQDEMLCELETDKVSVEVPAPASGTLAEIYAEAGATVNAGGKLGRIAGGAGGGRRSLGARRRRRPGRRRGRPGAGGEARRGERALRQQADGRPRPLARRRSRAPAATAGS